MTLTTTQHSALGELHRFGALVPIPSGESNQRGTIYGFSSRTLKALVDAGHARVGVVKVRIGDSVGIRTGIVPLDQETPVVVGLRGKGDLPGREDRPTCLHCQRPARRDAGDHADVCTTWPTCEGVKLDRPACRAAAHPGLTVGELLDELAKLPRETVVKDGNLQRVTTVQPYPVTHSVVIR